MGQKLDKAPKGAYDAIVYIDGSEVVAEDGDGRKIASGVAGINDVAVLQYVQDDVDIHSVFVSPGTYSWKSSEWLVIKKFTQCAGIDQTIFKSIVTGGLTAYTLVEMEDYASIQDVTIDGQCLANINPAWASTTDVPTQHGLNMGRSIGTILPCTGAFARRIKIQNTLKSNLVMSGIGNVAEDLIVRNSWEDHNIYFASATNCRVSGVYLSGTAFSSSIVFGTSALAPAINCILENVRIDTPSNTTCPFAGSALAVLLGARFGGGNGNLVRNVYINTGAASISASAIISYQPVTFEHITAIYPLTSQQNMITLSRSDIPTKQVLSDVEIVITDTTGTSTVEMLNASDVDELFLNNVRLLDNDTSDTATLGLRVATATVPCVANLVNCVVKSPRYYHRLAAPTYVLTVLKDDVACSRTTGEQVDRTGSYIRFLDGNSGSSTGTGSEQTIAHGLAAIPTGCKAWIRYPISATVYAEKEIRMDATNIYPKVKTGLVYDWRVE